MNNKIDNKVDEIINEIEDSIIYKKYIFLKNEIENNKELMELINRVRIMQKDVLHKKKEQKELDKLVNELNSHPLYIEYNNTVFEINNSFAIIENRLNKYFENVFN